MLEKKWSTAQNLIQEAIIRFIYKSLFTFWTITKQATFFEKWLFSFSFKTIKLLNTNKKSSEQSPLLIYSLILSVKISWAIFLFLLLLFLFLFFCSFCFFSYFLNWPQVILLRIRRSSTTNKIKKSLRLFCHLFLYGSSILIMCLEIWQKNMLNQD